MAVKVTLSDGTEVWRADDEVDASGKLIGFSNYTGEKPGQFYDPNTGKYLSTAGHAGSYVDWSTGQRMLGAQPAYSSPLAQQAFEQEVKSGSLNTTPYIPPTFQTPLMQQATQSNAVTTTAKTSSPSRAASQTIGFNGGMKVRMPDGSTKVFFAIDNDLNAALLAGGKPLRADGSVASLSQFQGGWLADNKPLNVFGGGGYLPGQQDALRGAGLMEMATGSPAPGTLAYQAANLPVNTAGKTTDVQSDLINRALALFDTEGRGLSPATKAMLTTQALEEVPKRFDQQARDLATRMLRDNPAGLPRGGEFLRGYGPFEAAKEATRAGLVQQAILADEEERVRSREADRAFGLQAIQTAGQLAGQRGQLELGQQELTQRFDLAKFDADTRVKLEQMGIDSNEKLAALDADLRRDLNQSGIDANLLMTKLNNETQIELMRMKVAGDKTGLRIAAGVASSMIANPKFLDQAGGLIKDGVNWVKKAIGLGGSAASTTATTSLSSVMAGTVPEIPLAASPGASLGIASAGPIGSSTGFGAHLAALATNPITLGIAAAAAAGFILFKKFGTDHLRADQAVQEFENPFADSFIKPMHAAFFDAASKGQLTQEQAQAARAEFVSGWEEYQRQIKAWAGDDGSKKKVASQSISDSLWPLVQRIVGDMDRVIAQGGYDWARTTGAA